MNNNTNIGLIVILVVLAIIVLVFIRRHFKQLIVPNVFLVTGAVKSGKTFLSLHEAIKIYKRNLRHYYIQKALYTLIGLGFKYENPPMFYSNVPVAMVKFNPLTEDIIYRRVRIPDKSVVFIDEVSLLADSMMYNDENKNNALILFYKLFAHYTHGGTCVLNTQSLADNHFSAKRCIGSYIYIYKRTKLPFFTILKVREMISMDGESTMNVIDEDLELSTRTIVVLNSTYKKYDCYAFSSFTDYLPMLVDYDAEKLSKNADLKVYYFVTLQKFGLKMNKEMQKHLTELEQEQVKEVAENGKD